MAQWKCKYIKTKFNSLLLKEMSLELFSEEKSLNKTFLL